MSEPNNQSKVIVVFKDGTSPEVIEKAAKDIEDKGGKVGHRFTTSFQGFSASIHDDHMSTMSKCPDIDYMEPDGPVSTCGMAAINKD